MNDTMQARILVVDDDDWILSGISVALTAEGFEVRSARDGDEGLETAICRNPDLIITDVMMPRMDGGTFIRHLRANPLFALVPVLFLSTKAGAQDRITGFQLGADDYLGKPVNLADLPRRVLRALSHRRQLEEEFGPSSCNAPQGKGLKGSLDQIGMATLLSVLSNGRRSGILRLRGALPGEVLLYLVRGQIHRVEVQGRGRLTSEESLQQLFRWLEGEFEFTPIPLRLSDELHVSTNALLLAGARQACLSAAPV